MTSPLVWFRLYRGKVWHLRLVSAMSALCETPDLPYDHTDACERVYGPVPENARLCEACGAASDMIADAIRLAREGDPRRPLPGVVGDLVGVSGTALHAAVAAELHGLPEVPEDLATLAEEVRASRETAHLTEVPF